MKVASYDIVFQEIPGEVTLALNLSGCPCHCPGCHSPHLAEDIGEELTEGLLDAVIEQYANLVTCVCFMGGDGDPLYVFQLAKYVKELKIKNSKLRIKTAWYSGRPGVPEGNEHLGCLDYVKFGPYIEALGGLKSERTNQRLYKRVGERWEDITSSFWKKSL